MMTLQIFEGPKVSLSPKISDDTDKFRRLVPGPGSYTPNMLKQADFSYSFGLKTSVDFKAK